MTFNKLTLAGAAFGILMTSCSSFNPEKTAKQWDVVSIGSQQVVPGPNSPYLGFDNGTIYGFTGCNRINGGIEIDGNSFSAKNVATTMKLCPNAIYEQDFMKTLNEASEIKETENGFDLLNNSGEALASFTPHQLNVETLEGQWNLISLDNKEIAQDENTPFLIFDIKEKRLSGFTSCNRINDNLDIKKLENCELDLSQMAMTRKLCADNVLEADFIDALNTSKTIKVLDNKLYIYNEDDVNFLVFSKK